MPSLFRGVPRDAVLDHPDLQALRKRDAVGMLFFFGALIFVIGFVCGSYFFIPSLSYDWANYTTMTGLARSQADAALFFYGLMVVGLVIALAAYSVYRRIPDRSWP